MTRSCCILDPDLRGRLETTDGLVLQAEEPLADHTTFRIGGPAELFATILTELALQQLLTALRPTGVPFHLLGLGSNVLLPDEGLAGVVALLAGEFLEVRYEGELVQAGAGMPLARLARRTLERGLVGLEALAGFPSTVGGAVLMNAGCYGVEIKDVLESVTVVMPDGRRRHMPPSELEPGYRRTNLQGTGAIVSRATFRLPRGDAARALARMESINRRRRQSLPSGKPNVGSIFKNPPGDYAGRLIEACGLKGTRRGGAQISARHANVIVNVDCARAADVLELMLLARSAVGERFDVALEPEVILVGELRRRWLEGVAAARPESSAR